MSQFFQANVAIDLQFNEEGLERCANLSQAGFSENKYILLQTALVKYHTGGNLSSFIGYSLLNRLNGALCFKFGGWCLKFDI